MKKRELPLPDMVRQGKDGVNGRTTKPADNTFISCCSPPNPECINSPQGTSGLNIPSILAALLSNALLPSLSSFGWQEGRKASSPIRTGAIMLVHLLIQHRQVDIRNARSDINGTNPPDLVIRCNDLETCHFLVPPGQQKMCPGRYLSYHI